ncbi:MULTISPECIES: D-alanyl-D-alanine carboxypeptidase family protein [Oceanobacillus]|uniref:serine-type D-Ala-D-Ala carboxypeptidase n=1 Tax=Oceanobacillus oncorhynchi TaxID=545501 RepID=A0A0A1MWP6_9BACI|nr:D-alanyl-D-alanine carboxypeptidase family protein [Oceanobacillus oncorhynchi]UUI38144.1 D-alanyl-D-alanine carboxypeptidase [Oceanobacillus oncorhynchi]CEI83802.1 D-alanyl-D-alanine carboxypeptidase DacF precursor [Oceanobacillus oncorhynchi]
MKRRILCMIGLLIGTIFFNYSTVLANEENKEETKLAEDALSSVLIEQNTGTVLFDKDAHEQLPPASMTKIMTLLLIMEALEKEEISKEDIVVVSEYAASMGGSQVFLEAGEEMSVDDLIKGIAIASGNDASVAMAEKIAGTEEEFVRAMNKKAEELALENTHFANTTGLPAADHYSSAYDMAVMTRELLHFEDITNYTSIYEDYLRQGEENEFWLVNTNKLIRSYPGADGMKTGYTNEAKYCLTATAKRDDMRVIAVVMGAETPKERNKMISGLMDYGFQSYKTEQLFAKEETVMELNKIKADPHHFDIVTEQSVHTLQKKGQEEAAVTTEVSIQDNWEFPVKKGTVVGELTVKENDEPVYATPLIVNEDISEASVLELAKRTMQKMVKAAD